MSKKTKKRKLRARRNKANHGKRPSRVAASPDAGPHITRRRGA